MDAVSELAETLKEFKDQMIFIGGAVVSLYVNDLAVDEIHPTSEIDMKNKTAVNNSK